MKRLFMMSLLAVSTVLSAQQSTELKLWPNGAPNTNDITTDEQEPEKNRISNVTVPTLTIYPATQPNGLAIIMCPGGGYTRLAMDHEGHDMAQWFNTQGITYAVLKYRMPNGHSDIPLSDAHQAIRLMREHAKEWNFTKLGIMGASAGGHLASTAATHYTAETRPDFQILLYPVVSMNPTLTHKGSHDNLLGKNPSKESDIIRKTKCFDFWERNVLFPKTKRSFFRTPKHPLPCPFPLNFSLLIITKKFGNLAKNRYICIV